MKRILLLSFAFLTVIAFSAMAQRTVSGKVTDDSGETLPGVNVVIKGTTTGTTTDLDGNFRLSVDDGATLVFSFVGFETQEVEVGSRTTIDISMGGATELQEVVVTAQGIQKEARSLGYAVTNVDGSSLSQKAEGDVGRILSGKTAGVNVGATNGISGSGTNIIIRGYTTITGSNQPLWVVDGVPFDGGTNSDRNRFLDGSTESSRFLDLDPNNIETMSVLKGLNATVLYGDRGRNGVILVTTKNGSSSNARNKTEVSVNQSFFIAKPILPDYQQTYGGGFHQDYGFFFSNWGPRFDADISSAVQYIGQDTDGTTLLQHPFNFLADQTLVAGFEDIAATPYRYQNYNGVEDFFRDGKVSSTSVNVRGGGGDASYNVNFGRFIDEGITPGNDLERVNFGFGGNAKLTNGLTFNSTVNLAITDYDSPPIAPSFGSGTGFGGGGAFGDILYTPRSVDLTNIPFQSADGRSVYYRAGNDIQNPYWTVNNVKTTQDVVRIYGQMGLSYDFTDWLSATYRVGLDDYTEENSYGQNRGGVDGNVLGLFRTETIRNRIVDHSFLVNMNRDINESLNLNATIGAQARKDTQVRDGVESTQQLAFGTLEHFNFVNVGTVNSFNNLQIQYQEVQNRLGVYFDATLGYQDFLYVNILGRNDWTSTLESENNSIFYPGASVSFIPTSAFSGLQSSTLNYLKVRFGYGQSAGFPPLAYSTRNTLLLSSRSFVDGGGTVTASNAVSGILGNANLKPEVVSEFELGVDTRLFGRANLNVSVYQKNTTDLITNRSLDDATGFTSTQINAGEIEVKGIEIESDVDVLTTSSGLKWNLAWNFTSFENKVTQLDTDQILLTQGVIGQGSNNAVEGESYGVILGSTVLRDEDGNRVVGGDGIYLTDETTVPIGDPIPDFTTGIINTVTFKGFTLYIDVQYRQGGDFYSLTASSLGGRGVADLDNPINREALYILPGVTEEGAPNTTAITATNLGFDVYGFGPNEYRIFDGTTLRLNEVSLAYDLPQSILNNTPFGSVNVKLSGQNLWYEAFGFPESTNFDTNSNSTGVGNGLGVDFLAGPSTRRFGVTLGATF